MSQQLPFDKVILLAGDRLSGEDPAVQAGLAWLSEEQCAFVAIEDAHPSKEGIRKAARVIRLAEHLRVPLVLFDAAATAYRDVEPTSEALGHLNTSLLGILVGVRTPMIAVLRDPESLHTEQSALYDVVVVPDAAKRSLLKDAPGRRDAVVGFKEECRYALLSALRKAKQLPSDSLDAYRKERLTA